MTRDGMFQVSMKDISESTNFFLPLIYTNRFYNEANPQIPAPQYPSQICKLYETGDGLTNLQSQMGFQFKTDEFGEMLSTIRDIARSCGVDLTVYYSMQDPALMSQVKKQALDEMSFLREKYVDGWPVDIYLKMALKSHLPRGMTPVQKRTFDAAPYKYHRSLKIEPPRKELLPRFERIVARQRIRSLFNLYGALGLNVDIEMEAYRRHQKSRHNERYTSTSSNSGYSPSPSDSARTPVSRTSNTRPRVISGTPWPDSRPSSHTASTGKSSSFSPASRSRPAQDRTILGVLSHHLPPADAEQITELLASLGIKTLDYFRVLAGMSSRDEWLHELRDNGQVSEIQMRVLREVLDDLVDE